MRAPLPPPLPPPPPSKPWAVRLPPVSPGRARVPLTPGLIGLESAVCSALAAVVGVRQKRRQPHRRHRCQLRRRDGVCLVQPPQVLHHCHAASAVPEARVFRQQHLEAQQWLPAGGHAKAPLKEEPCSKNAAAVCLSANAVLAFGPPSDACLCDRDFNVRHATRSTYTRAKHLSRHE